MINLFGDVDVGRGSKLFVLMVIFGYSIGIDDLDVIRKMYLIIIGEYECIKGDN